MNGRIDSGLGQIVIDTDVIATYAGKCSSGVLRYCWYGSSQHEGWSC